MEELNIQFPGTLMYAGTPEMADLFKAANINLEGVGIGGNVCQFAFAVSNPVEGENAYNIGFVSTDTETMNAILQLSAAQDMEAASDMQPGGLGFTPRGAYDCDAAKLMALYAQYTRGQGVGKYYLTSIEDVFNLLSRSSTFQASVNDVLNQSGYEGVTGYNAIPLLKRGFGYYDAEPPECGTSQVVIGDRLPPVGGIDMVVHKEDSGYSWKLWGGILAAGVAGAVIVKMAKKGRSGR